MQDSFDSRFVTDLKKRKEFLDSFMANMTPKDLQMIIKAAEKLEIPEHKTRPAVDVLYDIAVKLSILEKEIISPQKILDRVKDYINNN